jgi:hypothetical protein
MVSASQHTAGLAAVRPYQRTSLCDVVGWIILVARCSQAGVAVPKHTPGLSRPALRDNLGY